MTDNIRDWICRRRAVFWREKKKTAELKNLHDKIKRWITERKIGYVEEMRVKMLKGDTCVKGITSENSKSKWSPRQLYPALNNFG